MAELGETNDPRQLVPGDPAAVSATASALRTRAGALERAGAGLKRIDTADGWSGPAADAFRAKFQGIPGDWLQAADSCTTAADLLDNYATTLTWAQGQAATAISQWRAARATSDQAGQQYRQYQEHGGTGAFTDPGDPGRAAAQSTLGAARSDLRAAGDEVAGAVGAERDKAPRKRSFWSKVKDVASGVGAKLENLGGHVVDALASTGNAMIHHPGDTALVLGGALLTDLSAGGEAVGAGLDLTGIGAIAGVPLNVVSAAGLVAGTTMAGAGATDLMMHAGSDDAVSPASTDHAASGGSGSGITGDGGEMIGSKGTQLTSKTMWLKGSYRIDVENPNPGQRPGQIHFQDQATGAKYMYNFKSGDFDGMPNSLKKELAKKFPDYLKGITKGRSALGE